MALRRKNRPAPGSGPTVGTRLKRDGQSDEKIYRDLFRAIIEHRIPPGTPLQESALTSTFGVSRTIIRKVLQRLAHAHLVDLVPNRGAAVAKPSAEAARNVFDARRVVESILIERVAATVSDEGIEDLRRVLRLLARLAGNDVLAAFLDELISRTSLIIALYESPGAVPCSHGEHMEILGALKRRDAKKSAQYMDHHLRHIEAQIELSEIREKVDFKSIFPAPGGGKKPDA
jgi:DNA-binding GntR family transcriptional regulator